MRDEDDTRSLVNAGVTDTIQALWRRPSEPYIRLYQLGYAGVLIEAAEIYLQTLTLMIFSAENGKKGMAAETNVPGPTPTNLSPGSISIMPFPPSAPALPSSLRPATTAGISLGAISGAAILIALMICVCKWRRDRNQARATDTNQEVTTPRHSAELQGDEEKGNGASELETQEAICELPSPVPESEAASTWKGRRGLEDELISVY
ncbi:hypothetical protein HBI56_182250 [Parastagonospora nodorum]|uniref:Uncharacterized protein n=1 Tax=Phaeosphaeria nodorum (strain SN15 / ATCC MYA-4574 / FGSC 10173) TaxID=321614 RepID=A0A7U2I403_PHANO|nr:hypothetical protein HBH56_187660 [Parastagonospora nodorum]QRD00950.1 hypothetical protein JI435_438730 [Parastagonospora nodorum SN15]KAH3925411.1 hypothetical protein HBH54_180900 [Parastagonospora nodorum]KAH3959127.1 hypothetical protein HBH52_246180 [Parastagonospora nodorum]KAH3991078.1 hypothetical protein HBI10_238920 [Parastagonospora nodorum]